MAYQQYSPITLTNTMTVGLSAAYSEFSGYYNQNGIYTQYYYQNYTDSSFGHYQLSGTPFFRISVLPRFEATAELSLSYYFERYARDSTGYAQNDIQLTLNAIKLGMKFTLIDWFISAGITAAADLPVGVSVLFDGVKKNYDDGMNITGGLLIGFIPKVIPVNLYCNLYANTAAALRDYYIALAAFEWQTSRVAAVTAGIEQKNSWNFSTRQGNYIAYFASFTFTFGDKLELQSRFDKKLTGRTVSDDRQFTLSVFYNL
ncbi:MAG: hypothetical protein HZC28_15555 [Spirochaetes bacterium]|nr:hypothetical protein [Spirochaetota bacterium]